ncbi:hypothetical protein COB55_05795 [Candidatus Wolfebacteria bacterium]|nr:MAG: hypothetical protein COB55_05795 [Candidatus Wolfebacteria bacterium]
MSNVDTVCGQIGDIRAELSIREAELNHAANKTGANNTDKLRLADASKALISFDSLCNEFIFGKIKG